MDASDRREDPPQGDDELDAVLAEFGGDWRAAVKALLHDLDVLAGDYERKVSRGYVRGDRHRAGDAARRRR